MNFKSWFFNESKQPRINGYGSDGTIMVQIGNKQYTYNIDPYQALRFYELGKSYLANKELSSRLKEILTWKLINRIKVAAKKMDHPPEIKELDVPPQLTDKNFKQQEFDF
jgi:hypothetical protein